MCFPHYISKRKNEKTLFVKSEEEKAYQEFEKSLDDESFQKWGVYGDFELVGHGKLTNSNCGRFVSFKGCLHTELHNKTTLDRMNYKGKVFVRKVHASCDKPTCPVCLSLVGLFVKQIE